MVKQDFRIEYTWRKQCKDMIGAFMVCADIPLDVNACVQSVGFDRSLTGSMRATTLMMISSIVLPHVVKGGMAAREAYKNGGTQSWPSPAS